MYCAQAGPGDSDVRPRDMTRVPLEDYRANLRKIVAQCRAIGAEVMLCYPNNVRDTESRPTATLLEYAAAVREVAAAEQTALADCYNAFEAMRDGDARAWAFLMSDEIHPNMAGHKLIADHRGGGHEARRSRSARSPRPSR